MNKTVDRDSDVVRSDSLHDKVAIVYGCNSVFWASNSGAPGYTVQYSANVGPAGVPFGIVERPADNLSSPPAVGSIRKKPHLTITEAPAVSPPVDALTRRQRDVLYLIVQGRTNKEIARSLGLGEGTVKIHVAALFGKLGVHRRAAIAVAGSRFLSQGALQSA